MNRCQCGWHATVSKSVFVNCPLCKRIFWAETKEDRGRQAWALLHAVIDPTPEWYEEWLTMVPSFGCECRRNWDTLTAAHPPDFENFHQWAIDRHNDVNRSLGKPEWHPSKSSDKPST